MDERFGRSLLITAVHDLIGCESTDVPMKDPHQPHDTWQRRICSSLTSIHACLLESQDPQQRMQHRLNGQLHQLPTNHAEHVTAVLKDAVKASHVIDRSVGAFVCKVCQEEHQHPAF